MPIFARILVALLLTLAVACGGGGGGGSSGGSLFTGGGSSGGGSTGGGSTGGGSTGGGSTTFSISNSEPVADPGNSITLTSGECYVSPTGFTLSSPWSGFYAHAVAQYAATFYILNQSQAQSCSNQQGFSNAYLLLNSSGQFGLYSYTNVAIPAGTWYLAVQDLEPNHGSSYTNVVGMEVSQPSAPGFVASTNLFSYSKSLNPKGWYGQPFTLTSGENVWLDGSSTGGVVVIMSSSQYTTFESANSGAYNGGSYGYLVSNGAPFCNLTGEDAPEDCDLTQFLGAGSYAIVAINTTSAPQSYVAFAQSYVASSGGAALARQPLTSLTAGRAP